MPSLYEATSITKSILKWGGLVVGGFFLIVLLFRGGKLVISALFPSQPPAPKTAFGKLPAIIFPENVTKKKFSYSLDTISGGLGQWPNQINVYKTTPSEPNLLDLKTTRARSANVGFTSGERAITDTEYSWKDPEQIDRVLTINIVSKDFTVTSNYLSYPNLIPTRIIDPSSSTQVIQDFLEGLNLYPLDFDPSKTSVQLLSVQGASLFAASSPSTAQLVRVDLFQSDIAKHPIMYAHPPYSSVHFLIGGPETNQIFDATFAHQTVGKEATTYPIISVNKAYDLLKQGKAYIASYYGTTQNIVIKRVSIGYYMSEIKQDYMMPIYVFEGKDGFFAYVSAIIPSWVR